MLRTRLALASAQRARLLKPSTNGARAMPTRPPTIDTSAYGGPRLLHHDLVRMFSQSRVSLGFATAGDSHTSDRPLKHLRLASSKRP